MSLIVNLYYRGQNGSAKAFADKVINSGLQARIKAEAGNIRYDYFTSVADPETVLLIDEWEDQAALDAHHATPMMQELLTLREKYDLHMDVVRLRPAEANPADEKFIRK